MPATQIKTRLRRSCAGVVRAPRIEAAYDSLNTMIRKPRQATTTPTSLVPNNPLLLSVVRSGPRTRRAALDNGKGRCRY